MNLTELFIRRPIMTTLVMLAILLFGVMGYRLLPVSDLPNVDFPTILVTANLPGASPDTMASSVATPLERQFSTIAGLDSMTSTSALGLTQVTLQFNLSRNIDAAGFGALVTLLLCQIDLNLYAFVGIIMLVGIVKKNAIMMTTMAALMGTLPIALGFGAGAESRRPLGLAVVGGLAGVPGHHPLLNPSVLYLHGSVSRQTSQIRSCQST